MQPSRLRRIALFTYAGADPLQASLMQVAQTTLAGLGWRQGETARITRHFGDRDKDLTDRLARQITADRPDVVLSFMTNATQALHHAAPDADLAIVAWSMDLHATSLGVPGPRPPVTGMSLPRDFPLRQLQVLAALKPGLQRIGHLHHPGYALAGPALERLGAAASSLGLTLTPYRCESDADIPDVIATMAASGIEAVTVGPHEMFNANGNAISAAALAQGLPAIGLESLALHHGVAGFAPDFATIWESGAAMAARILNGRNVRDIPVDTSIPPLLVLNMTAIRALGLHAPEALIRSAHRVIGA